MLEGDELINRNVRHCQTLEDQIVNMPVASTLEVCYAAET